MAVLGPSGASLGSPLGKPHHLEGSLAEVIMALAEDKGLLMFFNFIWRVEAHT
jgi:hypothetical protein